MLYFDCNEMCILVENMKSEDAFELVKTLQEIRENTNYLIPRASIDSLISKILKCSPEELERIYADIQNKKIIETGGYSLR